jgi:hypothetical protein
MNSGLLIHRTVARWPEKIGGRKITKFCRKWQSTGRKTFYKNLLKQTIELFVVFWRK